MDLADVTDIDWLIILYMYMDGIMGMLLGNPFIKVLDNRRFQAKRCVSAGQ